MQARCRRSAPRPERPSTRRGQTFLEVARRRRRVRAVLAGHDERRNVQCQQIFRLRTRHGVAVEQQPAHARDDRLVSVYVQSRRSAQRIRGRCAALTPTGRPGRRRRSRPRCAGQRGHAGQPVFGHVGQMGREPRMLFAPVLRPTCRRVQHHARHPVAVGCRQKRCDRTTDARPHDVDPLVAQVVEQPDALVDVVDPAHPLHPTARAAGLTFVEGDAGEPFPQLRQHAGALIQAVRFPAVQGGVEATRREHQQRRTRPRHLIAGDDAVHHRRGHAHRRSPPAIWRDDRTSSA